jgi:hypothetical protein
LIQTSVGDAAGFGGPTGNRSGCAAYAVAASITIRARGRSPSTTAKRSGSVEDETPEQWEHFIALNKQFFVDDPRRRPQGQALHDEELRLANHVAPRPELLANRPRGGRDDAQIHEGGHDR